MCPKGTDGMDNSVDPDHIAACGTVWLWSSLIRVYSEIFQYVVTFLLILAPLLINSSEYHRNDSDGI